VGEEELGKNLSVKADVQQSYRRYVDQRGLYARGGYASLEHRCRQLFKRVGRLEDKIMLEIGGGEGLFSLWALLNGLKKVILLEPEVDGSVHGVGDRCLEHKKALGISDDRLMLCPVTIQEYEDKNGSFDLALSYSSINHLDEGACVQLNRSKSAKRTYLQIFEKVYGFLRSGGHFVISDAGCWNFWGFLGMRSPFAPTIDWEKHQEPIVWEGLLKEVGFESVALDWHRFYPIRWLGGLAANGLVARATTSQFILTLRKP
jgi:SAM-dependent methyltransferase